MASPSESFLKLCAWFQRENILVIWQAGCFGAWRKEVGNRSKQAHVICYIILLLTHLCWDSFFLPWLLQLGNVKFCAATFSWNKANPRIFWSLLPLPLPLCIWHVTRGACRLASLLLCAHFSSASAIYTALCHLDPSFHDLLQRDSVLGRLLG